MKHNKIIKGIDLFEKYQSKFQLITVDTDKLNVSNLCENLLGDMNEIGFEYRDYNHYRKEYMILNQDANWRELLVDCSLNTYIALITYFSREEHMSGGYGSCYLERINNGVYDFLFHQIILRLYQLKGNIETDRGTTLGVSGELFVAAELTRQGYVASLTSKNTKAIDLLASSKDGSRSICIQVKTCSNKKMNVWKMSKSSEEFTATNLYYVFVNLCEYEAPLYFVIPSRIVAKRIHIEYVEWKKIPRRDGKMHPDTDMRTFKITKSEIEEYQNAWYLLDLD